MSVKCKLLNRIITQLPWVREDAKIVRCYPSSVEREAGAFFVAGSWLRYWLLFHDDTVCCRKRMESL